jgi:hypothetical protein
MHDGPATTTFRLDYSDGTGSSMNEATLAESSVIGRTPANGAFADWNLDGLATPGTVSRHITDSGTNASYLPMHDYNDWNNLVLAFARYPYAHFAGASQKSASTNSSTTSRPYDPVVNSRMPTITEDAPPASMLARLHH